MVRYAEELKTGLVQAPVTSALLSGIAILDDLGAWNWNLRYASAIWFLLFALIRVIVGKQRGVEWYAVVHATITGLGGVVCAYLSHVMSEELIGAPEPLNTVLCGGPLTSLHRVLPTAALGYAIHDLIDGIRIGPDFLAHGAVLLAFALYICEIDKNQILAVMLTMEVSTIFLNLNRADFFTSTQSTINLVLFVITFFSCRILFGPWSTWQHVRILYNEGMTEEAQACSPNGFRHVILVIGAFFTVLNMFWFVKILQKLQRKVSGKKKVGAVKPKHGTAPSVRNGTSGKKNSLSWAEPTDTSNTLPKHD